MIASDKLGIARPQAAAVGIEGQAQHAQRPAFVWRQGRAGVGMAPPGRRASLHLAGTGLRPAGYRLQRIGIIGPARRGIDAGGGAEGAVLALPAGHRMLRGKDFLWPQPGEIIIAGVEGADMIEAEPAIVARPVEAGGAGAQLALARRAKLAGLVATGPVAAPLRAPHPAMESVVNHG